MRTLRWFVAVVLLFGTVFASVAFVVQNASEVQVHLPLLPAFYQPLWLVIAAAFFLGAFAASAGLLFQLGRKTLAVRRSEKRAKGLERELDELRAARAVGPANSPSPTAAEPGAKAP